MWAGIRVDEISPTSKPASNQGVYVAWAIINKQVNALQFGVLAQNAEGNRQDLAARRHLTKRLCQPSLAHRCSGNTHWMTRTASMRLCTTPGTPRYTGKKEAVRADYLLLAGGQGFEPQLSDPESDVLPIKLSPITTPTAYIRKPQQTQEPSTDFSIIAMSDYGTKSLLASTSTLSQGLRCAFMVLIIQATATRSFART